jgi:hypothetical protein
MKRSAPEVCPACGAEVPPRALACPECGADERTGWNEEATRYDGLDLPGESDDDEARLKDLGLKSRIRPKGVPWYWWAVGVVLLAILLLTALTRR